MTSRSIRPEAGLDQDRLRYAQQVSEMILAVGRRLQDNFTHHAHDHGLTPSEAKVLASLKMGGPRSMRAVALSLGLDPSNLTYPIDQLERRGIVRRDIDPSDRRIKTLRMTEAGEKLVDDFWGAMSQDVSLLEGLSTNQLKTLSRLLVLVAGTN